jgi:hypothetical protein
MAPSTMKQWNVDEGPKNFDEGLKLSEVEVPKPKDDEVLVQR